MKFPRRSRLLRSPFEGAAYAAVFFLLILFLALSTRLYTPGVRIQLPTTGEAALPEHPTIAVALDAQGQLYFQNQITDETTLATHLRAATAAAATPLTLVVYMDQDARLEPFVRLQQLARETGFADVLLATAQP